MPKIKADLNLMIVAYRAKIKRCVSRAELLTLSPAQFSEFLDLLEQSNATWKAIADTHARDLKRALETIDKYERELDILRRA